MLEIHEANVTDCPLIQQLAAQVWEPTYGEILSPEQLDYMFEMMYSLPSLKKQMAEQHHRFFLCTYNSKPCGYFSVERQGESVFHLQKIYILPSFQGKGVGRAMVESVFNLVRQTKPEGVKRIELNVNRQNKAKNFYERMGFHVAETGDFDIGNGYFMNDHIMAIEIK